MPRFRKLWWIRLAADNWALIVTFLGASLALESVSELLFGPATELVVYLLLHTIYFFTHITIQSRNGLWWLCRIKDDTSKRRFFMIRGQLLRHPLTKPFHLSNFLQMPNDCRMVGIQFFDNFMSSCKRISFDDSSQLVICFWQLATMLLIFKSLV